MLTFKFQKELEINTNTTVSAIRHGVVNARTVNSGVRNDVVKPRIVVSDTHRNTLKSPKDPSGQGQTVSTTRTLPINE